MSGATCEVAALSINLLVLEPVELALGQVGRMLTQTCVHASAL